MKHIFFSNGYKSVKAETRNFWPIANALPDGISGRDPVNIIHQTF